MDARTANAWSRSGPGPELARLLIRSAAAAGAAILCLAAVALVWRRLAGALVEPLPISIFIALGVTLACLAVLCRLVVRPIPNLRRTDWLITAAVLLAAVAVSLPGSPIFGLVALWGLVLGEEIWSWRFAPRAAQAPAPPPRPMPVGDDIRIDPPQLPTPHFPAEDVSQQITRGRASDGGELMTGWLRVALEPGQRTAAAHVAFCPPFAETPRLTVKQTSGPAARIKEGQLLPHGMRLEIKLSEAHPPGGSVLVEFTAQAAAVRRV
jgi:hypothetical protein